MAMKSYPKQIVSSRGVMLTLDPSRVVLGFKEQPGRGAAIAAASNLGLVPEDSGGRLAVGPGQREAINDSDLRFWMRNPTAEALSGEAIDRIQETFGKKLEWIGSAYRFDGEENRKAFMCPLPNVLLIKPTRMASKSKENFTALLDRYGLKEVAEKSEYLGKFLYVKVSAPLQVTAFEIRDQLLEKERQNIQEVCFENMPMVIPTATIPNDPLFAQQWNMTQIQAGGPGLTGWDISTGNNAVVVCVLDAGCDLTHPDLQFSTPGINLGTMAPNGSPTGNHGTACAGIAAASHDNSEGVSGVAGDCQIMPLAFDMWSDTEVAAGINYATNHGADVISMSFGWNPWDHTVIDPAIQNAYNAGLVMCVATHNYNSSITYPATNPLVMACGASDEIDNRKDPSSPDGETWGSNFGPEMSVVAPGVHIPTTDRQGSDGYNTGSGAAGNYILTFGGTSAATPHVAGLAALLLSEYPGLTNVQVRNIIERTAEKVGTVAYAETSGYANGTWNDEMGYGRINVLRALDFAEVMVRDYPGDTGVEPSTPPGGRFWTSSDIVIRPVDDGVFNPGNPNLSDNVERGQTNYLYVRVTNNGPLEARNVIVNARITPWVGLQFVYPTDWTLVDSMHVSPTPITAAFPTITAGGSAIAKFSISAAQVEDLWGWTNTHPWHPCLLASVDADNDYAFDSASLMGNDLIRRRNNLAQRNLSVIDVVAGATVAFPFILGNVKNLERVVEVVVDRRHLPKRMHVLLALDEEKLVFPKVSKLMPRVKEEGRIIPEIMHRNYDSFLFMDRTRLATPLAGLGSMLTLERGSELSLSRYRKFENISVKGGDVLLRNNKRFVEFRHFSPVIRLQKEPGQLYPIELHTKIPKDAKSGERYILNIAQRNERGEIVGGASVIYQVK